MATDRITERINQLRNDYARTLCLLQMWQQQERETQRNADALGYQIAALERVRDLQQREHEARRQRTNEATIAALKVDAELRAAVQRGMR